MWWSLALVIACTGCGRGFFDPTPLAAPCDGTTATSTLVKLVQSNTNVSTGTGLQAIYALPQQAGDLDVVIVSWDNAVSMTGISDSAGNTYVSAIGPTVGPAENQAIFITPAIAASASNQISVYFTASTSSRLSILEYSGIDPAQPIDNVLANQAASGSIADTRTFTTAHPHDLLVAAAYSNLFVDGADPSYSMRLSGATFVVEDREVQAASTYFASGPDNGGANASWVFQLVALRGL